MSGEPPLRVLLAEDESSLGVLLERYLQGRGHQVVLTADGGAALDALHSQPFDVALLDMVMPKLDGLEVLRRVREHPSPPECIIITGNGTIDTAIAAMKLGAYDYVSKPFRLDEIDMLVRRASEKRRLSNDNLRLRARLAQVDVLREFNSVHAPMQAVLALARRAAPGDAPVLITGEPGTGKRELARYIHAHSSRPAGPLVEAACAEMAAGRATEALFGREGRIDAGPSGAVPAAGLAEAAAGGTLVLADVRALDPAAQAALVEALVVGSFRRDGSANRIKSEVRFIATAAADVADAARAGSFRADLFDALGEVSIALPPLRDRAVDIPVLAHALVRELGGAHAPSLASETVDALQRYAWPGNVRELRNVLERAVLLAGGGIIHAHDLALPAGRSSFSTEDVPLSLQELERRHIAAVLQRTHWHQGRAAAILGISAKTLYRKMREYGFERPAGSGAS